MKKDQTRPKLRVELGIALVLKILLLVLIKLAFFSHPANKQIISNQVQQLIASPDALPNINSHHGESR